MEEYHFHGSESRDHCVNSRPASAGGDSGSAGTTPAEAEQVLAAVGIGTIAATSAVPPITNRGAQITIPSENRSLLDWVSFTLKIYDPHEVAGILGLDSSLFSSLSYGFSGYKKSLRFGNISIFYEGRDDMGCHIEMSGQGCRQFEGQFTLCPWHDLFKQVLSLGGNFTRLDFAIDNIDGALSLVKLCEALQDHENQVRTLFGEWRRILKGGFCQGAKVTGETIYLGSSKSHVLFRAYNKAQESEVDGVWIRFEIQLRDKRAQEAAKLFVSDIAVGGLAAGIINNYFSVINADDSNKSRCSLQPWWSEWLQATEKIRLSTEKATKYVSDSMDFIKRQYGPSLAMINKHLGAAPFKRFVQEVLEDGEERMGVKHEQILAASAAVVLSGGGAQ